MITKKYTIGNTLWQYRFSAKLKSKEVCKDIGISYCDLKEIEAGKLPPTWEQINKFASLYNQDREWLNDQLVCDEAVKCDFLDEKNILPPKNQTTIENLSYHPFDIESRRYIGSKAKLINWIVNGIISAAPNAHTFCDIFAGTGVVAKNVLKQYDKVILNDILYSNNVIYNGFFGKGAWDVKKVCNILDFYNQIIPDTIKDNWFSENYGGKYFSYDVAKMIGYVRQDIEERKPCLTPREYNILLASLIYSIDKLANTVGHYEAYIKKEIKNQPFFLKLINAQSVNNVEIYREDANQLAKHVTADITYLDPPYNSRQYCRFYHVYETLVKWDMPMLYGEALKPKAENNSLYCTTRAVEAFENLIKSLKTKVIAVSYNNTYNSKSNSSKNKIRLSQIKRILDEHGTTTVYEHDHRFFNAGKTSFNNHKEFLFITKVK